MRMPAVQGVLIAVATVSCGWFACVMAASDGAATPSVPVRWTPAGLSTELYESSPTFSRDGKEMFFFRADRQFGHYRLFESHCVDGHWSEPRQPAFSAPAPVLEADPALSPDGRRLYYVSSRMRGGTGDDLDIWFVDRDAEGAWGKPQRLPEPVNSTAAELLPRPLADGRLVFGSSRPGGHGQGDIYIATPHADGNWRVDNFGPPVSTAANEYEAEMSRDGDVLVVVADRGDRSHLYVYDRRGESWTQRGRVPARDDVFQVGPLLSPDARRLLFAQADGDRSGEFFVVDLHSAAGTQWPPVCR